MGGVVGEWPKDAEVAVTQPGLLVTGYGVIKMLYLFVRTTTVFH